MNFKLKHCTNTQLFRHIVLSLLVFLGISLSISSNGEMIKRPSIDKSRMVSTFQSSQHKKSLRIGIIGAMDEEINLLRKELQDPYTQTIANRQYYAGKLYGIDTILVSSRWGKVASASTATTLFNLFNPDIIIFTGIAGATDPKLNVGDIVLADKLYQHDMDASPLFDRYIVPLLNRIYFYTDRDLLRTSEIAAQRFISEDLHKKISPDVLAKFFIFNPKVIIGPIASGDQLIIGPKEAKTILNFNQETKAVEMEGAAIAQISHEYNKPFLVFRTISDTPRNILTKNFQKFTQEIANYYSLGFIKRLYASLLEGDFRWKN